MASFTALENEEAKAKANLEYNYSPTRSINIYSICLPLLAFAYDNQLVTIMNKKEYSTVKVTKFAFLILYWIILVVTIILYTRDDTIQIEIKVK